MNGLRTLRLTGRKGGRKDQKQLGSSPPPFLPVKCLVLVIAGTVAALAQVSDRALALHRDALVFDAHVHVVDRQFYHGGDMGQRVDDGQFDLVRAKEGGLDAMFFSLFVTEQYYPARLETRQVLRLIDAAYDQLARNRDKIELALSASDVERTLLVSGVLESCLTSRLEGQKKLATPHLDVRYRAPQQSQHART